MKIAIVNYLDADRRTAIAGAQLPLGSICKVAADAKNNRVLTAVTQSSDLQNVGAYAFAFKVSSDPLQVTSSTVPSELGNRIVSIASGDMIVEARRGTIMEYDPSLLDASLDPARAGALPVAGATLAVKNGLPCSVGAASAITTPVVLRCYNVVNGKVRVELV
jgi:hypothetical protein